MTTDTPGSTPEPTRQSPSPTPFHDLDQYVAIPRTGGLVMSPDGRRLVTSVSTLDAQQIGRAHV